MLEEKKVTVLIKSCLRLDSVYRLYKSIRKNYRHMPIVIVHDLYDENHDINILCDNNLIVLKFNDDIGLSKGRNVGLEVVTTPYFLLMDDDFVMPPSFNLTEVVNKIESENGDIMSLSFYDLIFFERRYRGRYREIYNEILTVENSSENTNLDFVLNCFIAKTSAVKSVLWDDKIKIGYEHDDFFIRAKKKSIAISHYSNQSIWHLPTFNQNYNTKRNNLSIYFDMFRDKHKINIVEHVGLPRYDRVQGFFYYKVAAPLYKRFNPIFLKLVDFYLK
jgi:glycosyltransferase involved in cell wall biosynthesis